MKVAIIGTRGIPASYGGFETFAEEISARLANDSFDVTVVCQAGSNRKYFHQKVNLRYSKFTKDRNPVHFYFDSLKIASSFADIILVCGVGGAVFYPFLKRKKSRIITHVDGREELRGKYSAIKKMYVRISQFFAARYSDHIIADSLAVMKHWRKKYEILRSGISAIEFGADVEAEFNDSLLEDVNLTPNEYYLVVCRMVPENNPDKIIKGFISSGSEKKLVLVGEAGGKYGDSLLRHASHKIIFLNGIYNKIRLATLRKNCFAYIHGHAVGGTNPSLLESMAAGNVCICHDNEFNRETTESEMMYFNTPKELSEKIKLFENMDVVEKNKMIAKGKLCISTHYNWDLITEKYSGLFNSYGNAKREFNISSEHLDKPDSIEALATFLRNEYPSGEIAIEKYLEWEYLKNPSGKAVVTLAKSNEGKIVSQYALAPVSTYENGNSIPATLSLNTLTAKGYRGKGLFTETANSAFSYCTNSGVAFTFGIPNKNSFPGFIRRLEFTHAGNLVFMTKLLNPYRLIISLVNRNQKKGKAIDFIPDKNELARNSVSELGFPADAERYTDFLRLWNNQQRISIHRTAEYIDWRYVQNPLRKYTLLKYSEGDKIKAIVVIRTMYLYGLKVCLVMDHLSLNKTYSEKLLNVVSAEAKRNQMDLIIAVAASKQNSQYTQLLSSGFRFVPSFLLPQQLPFIIRIHNNYDYWKSKLNNLRNWHFSFGDYDVF